MLLAYKTFTPEPTIHYTYTHREDQPLTIHRNNTSVPEAVREILTRNYPVYQCLKMKLMNFHSLAEFIQPHVQQLSGKEASINTLVVAIKRFSDTYPTTKARVARPQRRENLAFKRHSRRDHTSAKEPVLNDSQRIIRRSGRALRVPAHLSSLKLDQANPPRRRLRSRPWKNGASQGSGWANKRGQGHTQSVAACRDESRHRILHHRAVVQKRRKHPRCIPRVWRYH